MHQHNRNVALRARIALTLGLSALVVGGVAAQTIGQIRERSLGYSGYQSIASRLLPDDEVVNVTRAFDVATEYPAPGPRQRVRSGAYAADIVALIHLDKVEGMLVEDGAWIHTRLTGNVQRILRSRKADDGKAIGTVISAELEGGQLKIGTVIVRAGNVYQFHPGQQYVVFVTRQQEVGHSNSVLAPMEVENGRLMGPAGTSQVDLSIGLKLEDAVSVIRRPN